MIVPLLLQGSLRSSCPALHRLNQLLYISLVAVFQQTVALTPLDSHHAVLCCAVLCCALQTMMSSRKA